MKLFIITINRNNATGLENTLLSVNAQTCKEFEHIIIDGASSDNSVETIQRYDDATICRRWISEPDEGIYNAINKGISMATGEYIQVLNSGDCLASEDVVDKMLNTLSSFNANSPTPTAILYGNMLKQMPNRIKRDRCFNVQEITFLGFYTGTLNHSPAYIRRDLFEKYGYYLEGCYIADRTPEDVAAKLCQALSFQGRTQGRQRIMQLGLDHHTISEKLKSIIMRIAETNK